MHIVVGVRDKIIVKLCLAVCAGCRGFQQFLIAVVQAVGSTRKHGIAIVLLGENKLIIHKLIDDFSVRMQLVALQPVTGNGVILASGDNIFPALTIGNGIRRISIILHHAADAALI